MTDAPHNEDCLSGPNDGCPICAMGYPVRMLTGRISESSPEPQDFPSQSKPRLVVVSGNRSGLISAMLHADLSDIEGRVVLLETDDELLERARFTEQRRDLVPEPRFDSPIEREPKQSEKLFGNMNRKERRAALSSKGPTQHRTDRGGRKGKWR